MNGSQCMTIICLALVTAAASLYAGDVTESADIMLYPTFENMGVEVRHQGDANFNSTGEVFYRAKGQAGWKQGHSLVMVGDTPVDPKTGRTTNPRFYTSLFRLQEGTAYEVKVELKDPDGVARQPQVAVATTRSSKVPTGSGKHIYADPAAADGGDGSKARPFKTLAAAFNSGGPGDTIHLAKGSYHVYRELKTSLNGSEAAWVHILGEPGATITDADPALSGPGKLKWEPVQKDVEGRQIYKLPVQNVHRIMVRKTSGDPATAYPLWKFSQNPKEKPQFFGPHRGIELPDMVENYTSMNDLGVYLVQPDCVYLIPPKGMGNPDTIDLQVSQQSPTWEPRYPYTKLMFGHHILIENVTFEHSLNLRFQSNVILRRVRGFLHDPRIALGSESLVEDSVFIHNAAPGWTYAPPAKTDRGNLFWDSWHRLKNGLNDTHLMGPGRSTVIRYNHIRGFNNVIGSAEPAENFNIDVYGNRIEFAGDDCVEPDGVGINWRVYENHFRDFQNGISDAPISVGPFFAVRNVFQDYAEGAFKIRNKARGKTFHYHNVTCPQRDYIGGSSKGGDPAPAVWPVPETERKYTGLAFAPDEGGDVWMRTRNNVLIGSDRPYKYHRKDKHPPLESYDFDYDALGWMQDGALRAFKKVGGAHAVMLKSPFDRAGFSDYKAGDLRLTPAAAAALIDAGDIVKGINDGGPAEWQFKGKAPDIGLVEAGEPLPHYGPRPAPFQAKMQVEGP